MLDGRPNFLIFLTDDQGYGDLGCTGNPWIQTAHINAFYEEAVRFTDFHVSPLCTPTRGALMSGRRPVRNGAWATCWGRSILRKSETTMADVFGASGYRTGMFGKWHLGDNYPYRPQDRGFQKVVAHKGGGVGQIGPLVVYPLDEVGVPGELQQLVVVHNGISPLPGHGAGRRPLPALERLLWVCTRLRPPRRSTATLSLHTGHRPDVLLGLPSLTPAACRDGRSTAP